MANRVDIRHHFPMSNAMSSPGVFFRKYCFDRVAINMTKLSDIEGIGASYAEKLKDCGIGTQEQLLTKGGATAGRKD
tara:strand:- start:6529 stop:6759 length:231 start_codon:yes stop_codon:yes gene_type:complete